MSCLWFRPWHEVELLLLGRICLARVHYSWPCRTLHIWFQPPFYWANLWCFLLPVEDTANIGEHFLAMGLLIACGLVTTLSLIVHCNTAIRPKSIRCALVACGLKSVCQLATTLGITVRCNTTIRPWSVRCVLVACRQVIILWSATTLGFTIRYNTAIRPESVRYVLAFFQTFAPSSCSPYIVVGLSPQTGVRLLSAAAISLIPVRCIFVIFC